MNKRNITAIGFILSIIFAIYLALFLDIYLGFGAIMFMQIFGTVVLAFIFAVATLLVWLVVS